ncbi:hypothetical protein MmiEs2_07360 [Methanimicrococcus stummii]|uniref:Type II-A CRISPR-associated protein Csn2 n=1 Tax=Methanimicrococcus stummii TaxID=3028294 RepID=A0AA96V946_9EURY|nr:type II-A CRISPR-associated protein Csn2 [Methanimicrococcus sp. Es2]WNY28543.1 hypothetical protein MmiEs2_07360 [Methanimicrococcus sp. Es2]
MLLSYYEFDEPISFQDGVINILVIENPAYMTKIIKELLPSSDEISRFELYENDAAFSISDYVDVIVNPFSINLNERDILNKLYAAMKKDALDEELFLSTNSFLSEIETNIHKIIERQQSLLELDTPDLIGLFKVLNVRFSVSGSLVENICDYMDICSEYRKTKLFIFTNLKSFLTELEIIQLYTHINYHKRNVLFIENQQRSMLEFEITRIIDENLCEIPILGHNDNDIY